MYENLKNKIFITFTLFQIEVYVWILKKLIFSIECSLLKSEENEWIFIENDIFLTCSLIYIEEHVRKFKKIKF